MRARAATAVAVLAVLAGPAAGEPSGCRYDVTVSAAIALDVAVRCDAGVESLAAADRAARRHVTDLEVARDAGGLRATYRIDLGAVARAERDIDSALAVGDALIAPGSVWLLRPVRASGAAQPLRVAVRAPAGVGFATAQPVVDGAFRVPEDEVARAGFSAFGRLDRRPQRAAAGGAYEVVFLDGRLDVGRDALAGWIGRMVGVMGEFWRGLPGEGMKIFVAPVAGRDGVTFGRAMAGGGVSIVLFVGEHATPAQLDGDWILIHELVHLGSPFVRGSPWFMEGLATYLEPLVRARHGLQSEADLWTEFLTNMPRGAAVFASAGLAGGGRRGWYWGGALLMLLADVEMREASGGASGLEDCLRAVRRDVGNYTATIGVQAMIGACDAAAGREVLGPLAERYAFAAAPVDLDGLWTSLGLRLEGGRAVIDDTAPRAWVRRALLAGSAR